MRTHGTTLLSTGIMVTIDSALATSDICITLPYCFFGLDDLVAICKEFHGRVVKLEGDKWDLEQEVKHLSLEVFIVHDGNA